MSTYFVPRDSLLRVASPIFPEIGLMFPVPPCRLYREERKHSIVSSAPVSRLPLLPLTMDDPANMESNDDNWGYQLESTPF
ncbi:hypothetical protein BT69DRAFT_1359029 [Atractiella rhizophila]|nr:hypothetical protein BT69DRAFT_1359029 [Atractiella rhizophila]